MQFEKLDTLPRAITKSELVTLKTCGRVLSAVYCSRSNNGCNIKKIDKERYINLSTGEVKLFSHASSRVDDLHSIRSSLARLRDYINTNVSDPTFAKWVTLTYAENMTDTKKLYIDFDKFLKRMHYAYGKFEYIVAMEPQGRGAWHAHFLMIFPARAPYIPNAELANIWGNGFVKVKKLDNVDNVGAYLTAYLGDMELNSSNAKLLPKDTLQGLQVVSKAKKAIIKGGRLYLYPVGFNLYRCSRGISSPTVETVYESDVLALAKIARCTYSKIVKLTCEDSDISFFIYYRYYILPKNYTQGDVNNYEKIHSRDVA